MDRKLKIVGLLRFSVLTPTYYSETFDTLDVLVDAIKDFALGDAPDQPGICPQRIFV